MIQSQDRTVPEKNGDPSFAGEQTGKDQFAEQKKNIDRKGHPGDDPKHQKKRNDESDSGKKQHPGLGGNKDDVKDYNKKVQTGAQQQTNPESTQPKPTPSQHPHEKVHIRDQLTFSWQRVGGWDVDEDTNKKELLKNAKTVEGYIIDHFYGDWYWNTSLMLGTCLFAWLVARLGGGILSLGLVLLFTNSVYRGEFRRFNRNIRDDMKRVKADNRLVNQLETMEWMNSFLDKFWVIYMPALSEQVMFQANEILKDQAPGFGIEKLSLDEFTLGSKAPRVDSIKSYPQTRHDTIEMDWAFSFAPNDTDDMTKNEIKRKIDPKVALGVTVGKAFISKSLPILVEDMSFTGRMKVKLKLSLNFPHVKIVSIQFLEPPTIDYALKPIGGDTLGLDIMSFIPGLSKFVNGIIHSTLRPMLYAPNSLDINIEELLEGQSNDSIGVIAVYIKSCKNLKTGQTTKPNSINPYVQIKVSNNGDIDERTKVKKQVNDPIFLEHKYILVNQLEGNFFNFNVFHLLEDQADDQLIGNCEFPLGEFLQEENQSGIVKNIMEGGKVVGKLELDMKYFPTMQPIELDDGTKEVITDSEVGIMKITLHEARDLDISKSVIGLLNPYAEIYVNNELVKTCRKLRQTNEPSWEQSFESLITQQTETAIQVLVRDTVDNSIVANLQANLQDLVFESGRGQSWITCPALSENASPPQIRISAGWKPLAVDEETSSKVITPAPVGGIRIHLRGAKGLKNLESVGYVDPYVRLIMNGKLRGKTVTFAETVNPQWNAVYFLPVSNPHSHYLLEIMDAEPEGKDRSLGTAAINAADFLRKNEEGYYLGYDGADEIIEQPVLFEGEPCGTLFYSVSFFPTINAYSLSELHNMHEYEEQKRLKEKREEEQYKKDEETYENNPGEYEWIETEEDAMAEPPKIKLKLADAVKYRAGDMAVHLLGGKFHKNDVYVQTLFDEHAYPSGVSPKVENRRLATRSTGETFIRDLPNSKVIFRITKKVEVTQQKDILVEETFDTLDLYEKSFKKPINIHLGPKNSIDIQLEYIPSIAKLAPLDTILDVGICKLEIIGAKNLQSVDTNGKSDPLCIVKLDGIEVFKTDKKRRTLDPLWNEAVDFPMISRSRQVLLLEVYDWDLTHDLELLGMANLDLSSIPALTTTPFTVNLDTQGTLDLRATFFPEYVRPPVESKEAIPVDLSMVHQTSMKAVGNVTDIATGAVGTGIGAGADVISKGDKFFKGFRHKRKSKKDDDSASKADDDRSVAPSHTTGSERSGVKSDKSAQQKQEDGEGQEEGGEEDIPEEEKEFREAQDAEISSVIAAPNIREEPLPPPQKPILGHNRNVSSATDASSFAASVHGDGAIPGRLTIVEARGYSNPALDVKAVLKTSTKEKSLLKTRHAKLDKHTNSYKWSESVPFKSAPTGQLILTVRQPHTFGKSQTVAEAVVNLSHYVNVNENISIPTGHGEIVINLKYFT
ncbi:C2 domain family protein [Candida parapsilosis]|uniref:Tricalbin n=2 Tax=Candida parapsilosis TaxID=5480 RepID=G8B663_CANPC|nr:uncharacterized protein CPAR2_110300 [Candida parapsilosis]KAF6043356.1 C2 domain family protein [Candida parapsilosis]KAF6049066.1 C2 domain family protein [Candida parapsilosis]KAF6056917.1 C2 domain family protein [Candida parapsilosis]KAF6066364.1 C2 domain family protein [Candida parapsilosis]KAI5902728.1 Tricalbin-3 [Candida parapsilosis]